MAAKEKKATAAATPHGLCPASIFSFSVILIGVSMWRPN
jgi:hypothetical protein